MPVRPRRSVPAFAFGCLFLLLGANCEDAFPVECTIPRDCLSPCAGFCPDGVDSVLCFEGVCECNCSEPGTGGTGGTAGSGGTGGADGALLTCASVCPDRPCEEFSDENFALADWEDAKVFATDNTYSVDQLFDDGRPAPYRFISHTVGMNSSVWVAHTKTGAVYDPSTQGGIASIHCSFDGRALEGSRQASIRPLIEQDGRSFWTPFTTDQLINENGWVNKQWRDATWEAAGHSVDLELTASALPITLGFASGASHTTGVDMVTRNTGVDNWRMVICKE